jgi:hypothetical protein
LIIAVVAVIGVIIVAWVLLPSNPPPTMNEPTEDTKWTLCIGFKFKYRNLPGGWVAPERDRSFTVWDETYNPGEYDDEDVINVDGAMLKDNEHRFKLTLEVTGPDNLWVEESWEQDIDIGEVSMVPVSFGTKYCFLQDPGRYTVKATLHVLAPKEGKWPPGATVDDTIWVLSQDEDVG